MKGSGMEKQSNSFPEVYIMGGLRTPIGVYKGQYKKIRPEFLGAAVLNELSRKGYKADEIICGNAVGTGGNIGRLMALYSTYGETVPTYTVDMQCASSAMAIGQAFRTIRSGMAHHIIAGGIESSSLQPARVYSPEDSRFAQMKNAGLSAKERDVSSSKGTVNGLYMVAQFSPHTISPHAMLEGAHATACKHNMTKAELDYWTLRSHALAVKARDEGLLGDCVLSSEVLKSELRELLLRDREDLEQWLLSDSKEGRSLLLGDRKALGGNRGTLVHSDTVAIDTQYFNSSAFRDESIKPRISQRLLDRIPPILPKDSLLTAANTCYTHDGAAFIGLTSEPQPFKIIDIMPWAGTPQLSPEGAWRSTEEILKRNQLTMNDIDAVEWNEAFAVIDVLFERAYKDHVHKYNQLGGALAYGHAYGASGAVNLLHLMQALDKVNGQYGVTAIAGAGGTGVAMLIERHV